MENRKLQEVESFIKGVLIGIEELLDDEQRKKILEYLTRLIHVLNGLTIEEKKILAQKIPLISIVGFSELLGNLIKGREKIVKEKENDGKI